jgi:hypothetical protein
MVWCPAESAPVVMLAVPLLRATALPKSEPSTRNWTEPVGVPAVESLAETVAVKVTACP